MIEDAKLFGKYFPPFSSAGYSHFNRIHHLTWALTWINPAEMMCSRSKILQLHVPTTRCHKRATFSD